MEVVVDEEYDPERHISYLSIRSIDTRRNIEGIMFAVRDVTAVWISDCLETNAYYLEEDPPEEIDNRELKDLIGFYKECAANVPGLDE